MELRVPKWSVVEGEMLPPWYYGYSYTDWPGAETVFHPMPLNYLVRAGREISYLWDHFRSRPTERDREIREFVAAEGKLAYLQGVSDGSSELAKRIMDHFNTDATDGHSGLES